MVSDLTSKVDLHGIESGRIKREGGTSGVARKYSGGPRPLVRDGATEVAAESLAQRRRKGQKEGSKNTSRRWFEFGL